MIERDNGTMTIQDTKTTIEKEEIAIKGLKELIKKDEEINDLKSLEYHTMALKHSEETLERLKKEYKES